MFAEIIAAQTAARLAGATDAEVADIRRAIIDANRKEATGQSYAHEWQPPRQLPPEPDDDPPRQPTNPGRTQERRHDRF